MEFVFQNFQILGFVGFWIFQGWDKVLKAASKHFKKKKRDPTAHVQLSNYLKG